MNLMEQVLHGGNLEILPVAQLKQVGIPAIVMILVLHGLLVVTLLFTVLVIPPLCLMMPMMAQEDQI